jgi:hypothetical protein
VEKTESSKLDDNSELVRENIIVWLDFGAYAYINLGIISALSKLGKFNFIGLVATQEHISFFQNQRIVPFKELLYYPECYVNKPSFNLDNLINLEKKYDLHLWLNVFSERYFYKHLIGFHKFTKNEIFAIIENSISFFVDILERSKPKLILTQTIGENISNLLLYQLAKKMGIRILMPNFLHMRNKILMSNNLVGMEVSDQFKKIMKNHNNSLQTYDGEFIKKQDNTEIVNIISNYNYNPITFSQRINHYFKRLSQDPEPLYHNFGKTKSKMLRHRVQNYFEIRKRRQFFEHNSIKTIKDEKFLYFPLQTEPEATILTYQPFYSNQIALVENIARSIPINLTLYVKEHPIQLTKGLRPVEDYKKIIAMPNVKLVHTSVASQDLVSNSQGVIAISASTGFEALFYKKPVIIFGDEHYEDLSMVTKIKTLTELPDKINNALNNFKFNNKELNALMQAYDDLAITVPYSSMIKDGLVLSSIQRHENDFNLTLQHFNKFYETYKNYFELIAQSIYSKI